MYQVCALCPLIVESEILISSLWCHIMDCLPFQWDNSAIQSRQPRCVSNGKRLITKSQERTELGNETSDNNFVLLLFLFYFVLFLHLPNPHPHTLSRCSRKTRSGIDSVQNSECRKLSAALLVPRLFIVHDGSIGWNLFIPFCLEKNKAISKILSQNLTVGRRGRSLKVARLFLKEDCRPVIWLRKN